MSVVLRCTDSLQGRHCSQQGGIVGLLPSNLSKPEVSHLVLRRLSYLKLFRYRLHCRNNLSMYSSSLLLERDDFGRALHLLSSILCLVRHYQYHPGFLHLMFTDAITISPIFIEEEQVGDHGMF